MRKKIYSIHRVISLVIAIPVLLWAASGFMHPLMTNLRPRVATQVLAPAPIDSTKIRVPLQAALKQNGIDLFSGFRMVHIDTNWFYQVQLAADKPPLYLSAANGKQLVAGDWLYAQYLARHFLEGKEDDNQGPYPAQQASAEQYDCCDAATACVMNTAKGSKVANVSLITAFNDEYKSINHLLPVYKVAFERADGISVYVETGQDRFALAMNNQRAVFDKVFSWFHTWSWLDAAGKAKLFLIIIVAALAFITTGLGIYIFFISRSKSVKGNKLVRARRNHRFTAIVAATFTLMWTFSGAFHAFSKLKEDRRNDYFIQNRFQAGDIQFNLGKLQQAIKKPLTDIRLVKIGKNSYWQVGTGEDISYANVNDYTLLEEGDRKYAIYMASEFSGYSPDEITSCVKVTKFNNEYNFSDKRLPVWKVSYAVSSGERLYVETTSGKLASRVNNAASAEGYSFALLHKHHFLDAAGKLARDISTMAGAALLMVMVYIGVVLYFRQRTRKRS